MLSGKTVLIVESNAIIAVDLETSVCELGAHALLGRVDEGWKASLMSLPDVAIVDLRTAADLGDEFLATLHRSAVPVLFMTTDPAIAAVATFAGRHEILRKPYTAQELLEKTASLLA